MSSRQPPRNRAQAIAYLAEASTRWEHAVRAGDGPSARLAELADAAEETANAMRFVHTAGVPWKARPQAVNLRLTREFTAAAHADSPHRQLWQRLDEMVTRLGQALAGDSGLRVARAYEDLAEIARGLAHAVADGEAQGPPRANTG